MGRRCSGSTWPSDIVNGNFVPRVLSLLLEVERGSWERGCVNGPLPPGNPRRDYESEIILNHQHWRGLNRTFLSCLLPLYQNESSCNNLVPRVLTLLRERERVPWERGCSCNSIPKNVYRLLFYMERNTEKLNSLIFPLIMNYSVWSLYSHTNSYNNAVTQCHVDGSQRSLDYLWFSIAMPRGVIWLLLMRSFA